MHFHSTTSTDGVVERGFTLGDVTGLLWSPTDSSDPAPVVLIGHNGGQDKRAPGVVNRARHFVTACGFTVVAIDAPGHGDRPRTAADEEYIAALRRAQADGDARSAVARLCAHLAERGVPDWRATLDALGDVGPVAYWGVTLGTAIGVPLTAADPRIAAAVFGLLAPEGLTEAAGRVTVPLQFLAQTDQPAAPNAGTGLFDAFASTDKELIVNPASQYHGRPFELESSTRFLLRHLAGVERTV